MKIAILGSGDVARSLGAGLARHGHQVVLGTSRPQALQAWAGAQAGVRAASFADAAAFGDLAILAVKGTAARDVLASAGAAHLAGKVVIDACNPIAPEPPVDGVLKFFTGPNESLLEHLQQAWPQVRFVKAFSCVGHALMIDPQLAGGPPTMFIAGNDGPAKALVSGLLREVGWEPEDMGPAAAARAIEPLCILWCIPGFARNDWTHALRMLRPG